jgi:hypothetical protein
MDYTAEEERKYLGYGIQEDPDDEDMPPPSKQTGSMFPQQQEVSLSTGRVLGDEEIRKDPIMQMEFLVPVNRVAAGRQIVPYKAQRAAENLLALASRDADGEISLSRNVAEELNLLVGRVDEYTQVDPSVILSANVTASPTCRIYFEQVTSLSNYLLAMVTGATFSLEITSKTRLPPIPYKNDTVPIAVRPYKGSDTVRGQSFDIEKGLEKSTAHLADDVFIQVRAHMLSLGQLSPAQVCDLEYLDEQVGVMKKIVSGELVIVRPHKKTKIRE